MRKILLFAAVLLGMYGGAYLLGHFLASTSARFLVYALVGTYLVWDFVKKRRAGNSSRVIAVD